MDSKLYPEKKPPDKLPDVKNEKINPCEPPDIHDDITTLQIRGRIFRPVDNAVVQRRLAGMDQQTNITDNDMILAFYDWKRPNKKDSLLCLEPSKF